MSEFTDQRSLIQYCAMKANQDERWGMIFAIPNGMKTTIGVARKSVKSGLKKGVPDLFFAVALGGYNGLFIELKVGKNKTSKNQNEWITKLKAQGYKCEVCYGWEVAAKVVEEYLKLALAADRVKGGK